MNNRLRSVGVVSGARESVVGILRQTKTRNEGENSEYDQSEALVGTMYALMVLK